MAYMDGLNFPGAPSSCDPSATDQQVYDDVSPYYYEWDHNPFWYFTDVTSSGDCNNVVPYPGIAVARLHARRPGRTGLRVDQPQWLQ